MTRPSELTIDQLAAATGLTVRTVRSYAARGLLPPPVLRGRTGYYGDEHVERIGLVRSLLAEGYTLARIEQMLDGQGRGGSRAALALHRALISPWLPDAPQETDVASLAARAGGAADADVLEQVVQLGAIELLDDGRVRVLDPTLLEAGLQVVRLGIPPGAVVAAQQQVLALVEQAAEVYVQMFRDTLWRDFADRGGPRDEWDRVQGLVESLQPVAAQALLASFRTAMASAIDASLSEELARLELPSEAS